MNSVQYVINKLRANTKLYHTAGQLEAARLMEEAASILHQQEERIAELTRERDEAKREARDKDISYRTWKEFYGALLVAPPTDATPLEVRVHRQANVISDMQYRIRNLRKEIRRHLKADSLTPRWMPKSMAMKLRITQDRLAREHFLASQARVKVLEEAIDKIADFDDPDAALDLNVVHLIRIAGAARRDARSNALKSEGEI